MVATRQMGVRAVRTGVLRGTAFGVAFEARADDPGLLAAMRARLPPGSRRHPGPPAVVLALTHEVSDTSKSSRSLRRRGAREVSNTSTATPAPSDEVSDTSWSASTSAGESTGAHGLSVRVDGRLMARGLSHATALDVFESELQLSVARLARPQVFVHAGVVGVGGRAVLLPGRSGAGKTTLVRALVEAGATYYSDEYAVLDPAGRVHPYARRPSVRVRGGRKERHPVPGGRGRQPLPIGLVVHTRYRKGGRWKPSALSAGESVLALLANTVPARDRPGEVLAVLARATSAARGVRSDRGPAGHAARAVIALATEPTRATAGPAVRAEASPAGRSRRSPGSRSGRAPRGPARGRPRRRPPRR